MKRKIGEDGSDKSSEIADSDEYGAPVSECSSYGAAEAAAVGIVTSPTFSSLFSVTPSLSSSSGRTSVFSVREEKKACRRHRRRLARIVTEQWKYAARARLLALKFYRVVAEKLARTAFLEWKKTAQERSQTLKRVEELFPLALRRRTFTLWIKFTGRSRRFRLGLIEFFELTSARRSGSVLKAWRGYTDNRIMHQKQIFTAEHYYMVSCLSKCFSDWRLARQVQQKKEFYRKVAYAKWSFSAQKLALRAWNHFVAYKFEKAMAIQSWKRKTLSKCLQRWYLKRKVLSDSDCDSSVDSLLDKAQQDMFLVVVDSHFKKKRQRHILLEWSMLATSRTAVKLSMDRFYRETVAFNILKNSFHCLREYQSRKRLQQEQAYIGLKYWMTHRLRSCVKWWRELASCKASRKRREDLALNHWKGGMLRSCMFWWMEYCFSRRLRHEKLLTASNHWKAFCFNRWCQFSSESSKQRNLNRRAIDSRLKMVASKGFSAWFRATRKRKDKRQASEEQCTELKALLESLKLANVWRKWEEFSRVSNLKRTNNGKADQFRRTYRVRSVLRVWHSLLQEQTSQAHQHQPGVFYAKLLQRLAFVAWIQVQKQKPSTRESSVLKKCSTVDSTPSAKPAVRSRPAPRRPSFAFKDIRHNLPSSQSPVFDASSLSGQSCIARDLLPLISKHEDADYNPSRRLTKDTINELHSRTTSSSDYIYSLDSDADYSHVIADEVAWMEHLLANFEDLRAELIEKRAELALMLEKNTVPGSRENPTKLQILTQKIALLQQRRAIMLPTIQAVASVMPGLRLRARKTHDARVKV